MITDDQSARVDGLSWLSKATLDIIGLAGLLMCSRISGQVELMPPRTLQVSTINLTLWT